MRVWLMSAGAPPKRHCEALGSTSRTRQTPEPGIGQVAHVPHRGHPGAAPGPDCTVAGDQRVVEVEDGERHGDRLRPCGQLVKGGL